MRIEYHPIGVIHTPFTDIADMPIQPAGAEGVKGRIEIFEPYRRGLKDLNGFSHIVLLYHFHRSRPFSLHVIPFMDSRPRGVFATRAPARPNAIGSSVVRLNRIARGMLYIQNADMLDGTPLLDIKPFVPEFNCRGDIRTGWLEKTGKQVSAWKSDNRFQGRK